MYTGVQLSGMYTSIQVILLYFNQLLVGHSISMVISTSARSQYIVHGLCSYWHNEH